MVRVNQWAESFVPRVPGIEDDLLVEKYNKKYINFKSIPKLINYIFQKLDKRIKKLTTHEKFWLRKLTIKSNWLKIKADQY